jgi:hypothetical protein
MAPGDKAGNTSEDGSEENEVLVSCRSGTNVATPAANAGAGANNPKVRSEALYAAAQRGYPRLTRLLLDSGADAGSSEVAANRWPRRSNTELIPTDGSRNIWTHCPSQRRPSLETRIRDREHRKNEGRPGHGTNTAATRRACPSFDLRLRHRRFSIRGKRSWRGASSRLARRTRGECRE